MYHLSVADVDCHVVDAASVSVEEQISRLCLRGRNLRSAIRLRAGRMRKGNAVVGKYAHDKTGAVRTSGQTCAAPDIRIPNELACIINDRLSI